MTSNSPKASRHFARDESSQGHDGGKEQQSEQLQRPHRPFQLIRELVDGAEDRSLESPDVAGGGYGGGRDDHTDGDERDPDIEGPAYVRTRHPGIV